MKYVHGMPKLDQGMNVAKITNANGFLEVRFLEVHDEPCVALGQVYRMTIAMQGESPWVHVEYGEKGFPDEYFNVALLRSIILNKYLHGTPAKPTSEEQK